MGLLACIVQLDVMLPSLFIEDLEELSLLEQQWDDGFGALQCSLALGVCNWGSVAVKVKWEGELLANGSKRAGDVGSIHWCSIPCANHKECTLQPLGN